MLTWVSGFLYLSPVVPRITVQFPLCFRLFVGRFDQSHFVQQGIKINGISFRSGTFTFYTLQLLLQITYLKHIQLGFRVKGIFDVHI